MKYLDWILLFLCILCIITVIHVYDKPKKEINHKSELTSVPKVIHKVYIEHSMTIKKPLPKPIQEAHDSWKIMREVFIQIGKWYVMYR